MTSASETTSQHEPLHHQDEEKENRDTFDHMPRRMKKWLQWILGSQSWKNSRKKKLAAVSLVAVVALAYLRFSKRQRRITSSNSPKTSSNVLWPIGLLWGWWKGPEYSRSPQESTLSLLLAAARDGAIQQARIGSSTIFFQTQRPKDSNKQWNRAILPPNNESIKTGLLEALATGGCNDISGIPESLGSKLATPVLAALPFVYLALLYRLMKNQFGGEDIRGTNGTRKLWGDEEKDRTTFQDVAGLQSVVEDLGEVVSYLSHPQAYKAVGARPPRGVLLHGPPGSGKTLLARAVAGEAMCDSFTALSGSAFVEMYVGRGAARVRSLFAKARRDALQRQKLNRAASWWSNLLGFQSSNNAVLQRPACAILFIDELDAVAKARASDSIHGNDEREQTLNQLLTEMDGFDTGNKGGEEDVTLIVIAASNRVDVIDEAVLRRFDRQIFVGYPNAEGRKAILLVHAQKIQCESSIDWDQLASSEWTENFSGADLRNVVNEAALFAIREKSSVVEHSHLLHAARRIGQMKTRSSMKVGASPLPMFFSGID